METNIQIKNKEVADKLWKKYKEDREELSKYITDNKVQL